MRRLVRLLVVAFVAVLPAGGGALGQGVLGMGTMAPGSLSYATGSALAEMMVRELGIETRVQPSSGESTLLALLDAGELDFAVANALEVAEAFSGAGAFAGQPLENLRVAAVLYPLRVGLFVRADSEIESMEDLRGKRVTAGFSASAAIATLLEAALAGGGLTTSDIAPVPVPNVVAGADQFVDGRADAFFFAIGAAKVSEVDASVPLRLLPLDDDAAARQRVAAVFAEAYIDRLPAAPGLAGVTDPLPVLAFDNLLLTRTEVPADVVESVVAGIAEHHKSLATTFPPFRGLDPATLHKDGLRAPYHPAALAWADR
jgi:TRAP transporter TAXI family solute receptor